jgi:hypothetical protein
MIMHDSRIILNLASLLMGRPLRAITGIVAVAQSPFKAQAFYTTKLWEQHIEQNDVWPCAVRKTLWTLRRGWPAVQDIDFVIVTTRHQTNVHWSSGSLNE